MGGKDGHPSIGWHGYTSHCSALEVITVIIMVIVLTMVMMVIMDIRMCGRQGYILVLAGRPHFTRDKTDSIFELGRGGPQCVVSREVAKIVMNEH